MKQALLILLLFTLVRPASAQNQPLNRLSQDDSGKPMLIGHCTPLAFAQTPFREWFDTAYAAYRPDPLVMKQLVPRLEGHQVLIFLGTWCGDSKREVPRFCKLIDSLGLDPARVEIVTLRQDKRGPEGQETGANIHHVPTFIVMKDGKEVGRIIESPRESLEKDLLAIASGEKYTPHYQASQLWYAELQQKGARRLHKKAAQFLEMHGSLIGNFREFNTYGRVLLTAGKLPEALAAYKLNTLAFPQEPYVHLRYSNALLQKGDKKAARYYARRALELKPDFAEASDFMVRLEAK